MMLARWTQSTAVGATMIALMIAQPALAAVNRPVTVSGARISDVGLLAGGILRGKVVDAQGVPMGQASVTVLYAGEEIARTSTNGEGVFHVAGLRSGVHQLVSGDGRATCRFWSAGTAPPGANPAALVVSGQQQIRGQNGGGKPRVGQVMALGLVAAAIAIPIALSNNDGS